MVTPEKRVMNEIREWCGKNDYLCFRCNVGRVKTVDGQWFDTGLPSGFSDLLILGHHGDIYFCEVKAGKGRQREDQIRFQRIIEERGFKYILAYNVEEVRLCLQN